VRLTSTDGSAIELEIVGYESPHQDRPVAGVERHDWCSSEEASSTFVGAAAPPWARTSKAGPTVTR
jgi:hypothetical protein